MNLIRSFLEKHIRLNTDFVKNSIRYDFFISLKDKIMLNLVKHLVRLSKPSLEKKINSLSLKKFNSKSLFKCFDK